MMPGFYYDAQRNRIDKKDNNDLFPHLYNQDLYNIYSEAEAAIHKKQYIFKFKTKDVTATTVEEMFLLRLLQACEDGKITKSQRDYVLNNVFFYDHDVKVVAGAAGITQIEYMEDAAEKMEKAIKQKIAYMKTAEDPAKVQKQINKEKIELKALNKDIEHYQKISKNIDHGETKADLLAYIVSLDGDEILKIFNNTVRTSDTSKYVIAHEKMTPANFILSNA